MYVYRIGTDGASPVRFKHERRKKKVKKNWKKVLLTITAVLVAAGLAGCGKGNATGNTAGQTEQQAESTKEQKNQSQTEDTGKKDSVIVVMGPSSAPEAGFDPRCVYETGTQH